MLRDDRATYSFVETGVWPSADQELLLRAALLEGEVALDAWRGWRETIDAELGTNQGTFRLLPLLYQNLQALGVNDPLMDRLKGVYRWSWVETQQILGYMTPLLTALSKQGISTLMLKGAPLAFCYYRLPAMRPMADFDVLVRTSEVRDVIDFLNSIGWQMTAQGSEEDLHYRHSAAFRNGVGQEFDLHWHPVFEFCHRRVSDSFWDRSVTFDMNGIQTRRPDTTHNLLQAMIHGIRWNQEPPIRWIADAVTILKTDPAGVDWDFLTRFAIDNNISYRVSLGLRYLRERMDVGVPPPVIGTLLETRPTLIETIERSNVLRPPRQLGFMGSIKALRGIVGNYCRYAAGRLRPERRSFVQYLCYCLGLNRRRDLGQVVAKHVKRWLKLPGYQERIATD